MNYSQNHTINREHDDFNMIYSNWAHTMLGIVRNKWYEEIDIFQLYYKITYKIGQSWLNLLHKG